MMVIEDEELRDREKIFSTRYDAGEQLVPFLQSVGIEFDLILAIPKGGLPVARAVYEKMNIPEVNVLIIKRPQLPHTTESGFGAVSPDGNVLFNQKLIQHYNLTDRIIKKKVDEARQKIKDLQKELEIKVPKVANKDVLLVDDGIASGFSMRSGATWLAEKNASSVTIAVPTAPLRSLTKLEDLVDELICLNIRTSPYFAVASAYKNWYDLNMNQAKKELDMMRSHDQI